MGLAVNILTSGFLVTVVIFFILMGVLFSMAAKKMGDVLLTRDNRNNDLQQLDSAFNAAKTAYVLAFIAAALTLVLAILYAGHELVITPSEFWHLALYLVVYVLLIISVIYAFIALDRLYNLRITDRNGADAYLWAGLLMAVFAFVGLTATSSGRLGMNIIRTNTRQRVEQAEMTINSALPVIRSKVEQTEANVTEHLPIARAKIDELHTAAVSASNASNVNNVSNVNCAGNPMYVSNEVPRQVLSNGSMPQIVSSLQCGSPSGMTPMSSGSSMSMSSSASGMPQMMSSSASGMPQMMSSSAMRSRPAV
jgi:hypothetical protein